MTAFSSSASSTCLLPYHVAITLTLTTPKTFYSPCQTPPPPQPLSSPPSPPSPHPPNSPPTLPSPPLSPHPPPFPPFPHAGHCLAPFLHPTEAAAAGAQAASKQSKAAKARVSGKDAFVLYDTYGFPLEITQELAAAQDVAVDVEGFAQEMQVCCFPSCFDAMVSCCWTLKIDFEHSRMFLDTQECFWRLKNAFSAMS